ncbi:MAG: hypothetical protein KBB83_04560 [Alphaproteobacteria bacterium]|nr:hypothetical protein [Alphaproteobacteria bacterium]
MIYKNETHKMPAGFVFWLTKAVKRMTVLSMLILILISLTILLGGYYIQGALEKHKSDADFKMTVQSLSASSQEMRRREKDFFLRQDFQYADRYYVLSDEAMRLTDQLKQSPPGDKHVQLIRSIDESLQTHNQQFGLAVLSLQNLGTNKEKGLLGELYQTTNILNNRLEGEKANSQIMNFWLKLQLIVEKAIQSGDIQDKSATANLFTQMKLALNHQHKDLVPLLDKYLLQVNNLILQHKTLTSEVTKLTTIFRDFELNVASLSDFSNASTRESFNDVKATLYTWKLYINILTLLMAFIIGWIAIFIARKTVKYGNYDGE